MSTWNEIREAAAAAPYPVRIVAADAVAAQACRTSLGVSTQSWLGAVVGNCGALLVDHGWLRVLGSGSAGLPDVVTATAEGPPTVGLDVLGGRFAWPAASTGAATVQYFAPDTLQWEDLEVGYGDWLWSMLGGGPTGFAADLRGPGWAREVAGLRLGQGIGTYPPPWTSEGKDLSTVSRRPVPLGELLFRRPQS